MDGGACPANLRLVVGPTPFLFRLPREFSWTNPEGSEEGYMIEVVLTLFDSPGKYFYLVCGHLQF